jgi:hypothetical protein
MVRSESVSSSKKALYRLEAKVVLAFELAMVLADVELLVEIGRSWKWLSNVCVVEKWRKAELYVYRDEHGILLTCGTRIWTGSRSNSRYSADLRIWRMFRQMSCLRASTWYFSATTNTIAWGCRAIFHR